MGSDEFCKQELATGFSDGGQAELYGGRSDELCSLHQSLSLEVGGRVRGVAHSNRRTHDCRFWPIAPGRDLLSA